MLTMCTLDHVVSTFAIITNNSETVFFLHRIREDTGNEVFSLEGITYNSMCRTFPNDMQVCEIRL